MNEEAPDLLLGLWEQNKWLKGEFFSILSRVLEDYDSYAAEMQKEVSKYSVRVGAKLGLDEQSLLLLKYASSVSEIGMFKVPLSIRYQPHLTELENSIIREIPETGRKLFSGLDSEFIAVGEIIRFHHENWDGTGYPRGLKGEEIPIQSRIIGACEHYVSLLGNPTPSMNYRKQCDPNIAFDQLKSESGTRLDPAVVDTLEQIIK